MEVARLQHRAVLLFSISEVLMQSGVGLHVLSVESRVACRGPVVHLGARDNAFLTIYPIEGTT